MYFDSQRELLGRPDLESLQVEKLRGTIARATGSAYYRQLFEELKITPESIRTLDDLKRLPFTTKEHLRAGFPDGFLAIPRDQVVRMHASTGTTGMPTVVYHSQADIANWAGLVARSLYMAGVRSSDVFQNMMGYGLFTGGLGLHYGAERLGAMVIPIGVGNSKRQIMFMRQFGTTVVHIIPSYALKLLETFAELGLDPRKDTRLRIAVVGAEPHSGEIRKRIEEAYGVFAPNCYGLSEMMGPGVAFECPDRSGLHLWEDHYLLEIVDPATLQPLPDGDTGEIVLTTLTREAMPLIRYRTRDLARVIPGSCPCGRTHRRLSRIKGRSDDMLILKGVNIYPIQIEQVLMAMPEAGNNYLIVIDKDGPVDRLTVKIEAGPAFMSRSTEGMERLRCRIERALSDEILITPRVELVEHGSLPAGEGKAVRVVDNRPRE